MEKFPTTQHSKIAHARSTSTLPDAQTAFSHWQRAELDQQALSDPQKTSYALVWQSWVQQLYACSQDPAAHSHAQKGKLWHQATAEDVAHFLQIRPGQRAHHQPERQISEVTRRRYWRLLDRIYSHAQLLGWVSYNPVQAIHPIERPAPEQTMGHVLPQALWNALPRYFPGSDNLQCARDRAVLYLLYDLALAPEEVRALTMGSLRNAQQALLQAADKPCFVQIQGLRAAQNRCLPLPASSQAALAAWLPFRSQSGSAADPQAPLFESRKGGPLTIRALFHITAKTIALAQKACESHARPLPLARMGPQVMRNTAIVQWLHAGIAPTEVIERIGVEQVRALAHLQHCIAALQPIRLT